MILRRAIHLVVVCVAHVVLTSAAFADDQYVPSPEVHESYSDDGRQTRDILSGLTEDIDPFTGNLRVVNRLIHLPGNGGLDINVYWSHNTQRPDQAGIHFGRVRVGGDGGVVLELPDSTITRLYKRLYSNGQDQYRGRNNWLFTKNGNDYVAVDPNGITYAFNKRFSHQVYFPDIKTRSATRPILDPQVVTYTYNALTRITDRNGNWISISYSGSGNPLSVTSSDGRAVSLVWNSGSPVSVSSSGRTWQFQYADSTNSSTATLTLPNGQAWVYQYYRHSKWLTSVTSPYGGVTSYTYSYVDVINQFRQEESNCRDSTCLAYYKAKKQESNRLVIYRKQTSDGGTWTFNSFAPDSSGFFTNSPDNLDFSAPAVRSVTQPDGVPIAYKFVSIYNINNNPFQIDPKAYYDWRLGLLKEKKIGNDHLETYTWQGSELNLMPGADIPVLTEKQVKRNGSTYVTNTIYDSYARPIQASEAGESTRTTTYQYLPVTLTSWLLNFVTDETTTNGTDTLTLNRQFDARGNVTKETKNGVHTDYTYHADGTVASVTNARGVVTAFSDYRRGVPRQEIRAVGLPESITLQVEVDDFGNVTSSTNGRGLTTTFTYDSLDRLVGVTPSAGNPTTILWQPNSRTLTRGGYIEHSVFDGFGRTTSSRKHDSTVATQYDPLGRKRFQTYPNSTTGDSFTYDALDRVLRVTHSDNTYREFTYQGTTASERNERGYVTTRRYRAYGDPDTKDLISITPARGDATVQIQRNLAGQPLSVTQNGVTRGYGYDSRQFLVSMTHPETGVTVFGRDAIGNMTSRRVGSAPATSFVYDGLNRLANADYSDGLAQDVAYQYDGNGNLRRLDNGTAVRTYDYDDNDNLTRETLAAGGQTLTLGYAYNANDALVSMTYPDGRVVGLTPDVMGRPTRLGSYVTDIGYNARSQMTGWRGANGRTTELAYVDRGFPLSQKVMLDGHTLPPQPVAPTPPTAPTAPTTPTVVEPGAGISADSACRALYPQPVYSCSMSGCNMTYAQYQAALATWQQNYNACVPSWDSKGTAWSNGQAGCRVLYPPPLPNTPYYSQAYSTWQSNSLNPCVADWTPRATAWNNYRTALASYNTQLQAYNAAQTQYQQDYAAYQTALAAHNAALAASQPAIYSNYTYDGTGNLLAVSDSHNPMYNRTLGYDEIDRLTAANGPWGSGTITYDGNGNIRSQQYGTYGLTYTYNNSTQKLLGLVGTSNGQTFGTFNYSYDAWGNITTRGPGQNFEYDAAGNLRYLNRNEANQVAYGYDGVQTRVLVQDSERNVIEFTARNGDLVYEVDRATGKSKSHLYLGGKKLVDLITHGTTTTTLWYHNDLIGGPLASTNENGDVLWRTHYQPYGTKLTSGEGDDNAQWFAGKPHEDRSSLSYFGSRWYDPMAGRFTAIDPVEFQQGNIHSFNRFCYANDNPYRYVDPDGRFGIVAAQAFVYVTAIVLVSAVVLMSNPQSREQLANALASQSTSFDDGGAKSPGGRRGNPMEFPGISAPTTIGDRPYSGHAVDRMRGRGVPPSAVEEAITNGVASPGRDGATVYTDEKNGVTVIVNSDGKVVTVETTGRSKGDKDESGGDNNNDEGNGNSSNNNENGNSPNTNQ